MQTSYFTLKEIKDKYDQFWVWCYSPPVGNKWVMALRLEKDDEFYETGFLRVDYEGLCEFKYWDESPAVPIIRPS